ncbi:hypothetical protein WDU94_005548, partial [Cyamophila willieti]
MTPRIHLLVFACCRHLLHSVQCASCLEPRDLLFIQGVVQFDFFHFAVSVLDLGNHRLETNIQSVR